MRLRDGAELEAVRANGITPDELRKAKNQLRARLVFENDSITNIAHQLGFFATIASWQVYGTLAPRIEAVTLDEVGLSASERLTPARRTVGRFEPIR
jgi:zinc protease